MIKLIVDHTQRYAKMRAHTATHLLHAQLATLFPQTKQAWSLVDEDFLRFDFTAPRALSVQEIQDIEATINSIIVQWYPVTIDEMSYTDAINTWAKAFFEDKYGDTVRVVRIINHDGVSISTELCGGTHVERTDHIGGFCIIGQESVASWTRRIIAVTGPNIINTINQYRQTIQQIWSIFDSPLEQKQLLDQLNKFYDSFTILKQQHQSLQDRFLNTILSSIVAKQQHSFDHVIVIDAQHPLHGFEFKTIANRLTKHHWQHTSLALINNDGGFLLQHPTLDVKQFLIDHGIKGWGSPRLGQGKDVAILTLFS